MCNTVTDRLKISNDAGNDGAPDISFSGTGDDGTSYWVAGYLENNQRSRAVGLTTTGTGRGMTVTKTYNNTIVDPANIGRPTIARLSDDRSLFCSSNGNNRPPEIGVRCALIDSHSGESLWSELIAASEPNATPPIYFNQPQAAVGDNGRIFVQVEKSNGANRGNGDNRREGDGRGATKTHVYVLLPDDHGPHVQGEVQGIGLNQVHASICTGGYGPDDQLHAAIFDASITGAGVAAAQMARFDVPNRSLVPVGNPRSLGAYNGDSGYLANLYGQNPNRQGRDFMRCIGDVPNPGYGLNLGYQPDVASYFVFAYAGRVPGEEKNSLFVSFLPAHVPTPAPIVQHSLKVSVAGDGTGTVSSSPLGIDECGAAEGCEAMFEEGTTITLNAKPDDGSTFVGWSGACSGAGVCMVRLDAEQQVVATFTRVGSVGPDAVALNVQVSGNGQGVVVSMPQGLRCSTGTCTANFGREGSVSVMAIPAAGSVFAGWTGDCTGNGACTLTMNVPRSLQAVFNLGDPQPNGGVPAGQQPGGGGPGATDDTPGDSATGGGCSAVGAQGGELVWALGMALGLVARRRRKQANA
jgi:uncharacterized protein (TIGR03382 family)